jgi:hypothetical protein
LTNIRLKAYYFILLFYYIIFYLINFSGILYTWNEKCWVGPDHIKPPEIIITKLNRKLKIYLLREDQKIADTSVLAQRTKIARENSDYARAERIARRILQLEPNHQFGIAILCATLRGMGMPQRALDETDLYKFTKNPALLTSRAAAFCDLGNWEKAKKTIAMALAIAKGDQAFSVVNRIKKARPDLYESL